MSKPLGTFKLYSELTHEAKQVVDHALLGADRSADHKLCFRSDFPVGAGILAQNAEGETKLFSGCNVENDWFPATICAERSAATRAAFQGYTRFKAVAVFCRKYPGGSPCGLCRQVLTQFGRDAVLYNVVDHDHNVRVATVGDLLPAAPGTVLAFSELSIAERRLFKRVQALKKRSHVPYSKSPRGAIFVANNAAGKRRIFDGTSDDNASYGGSALAETVAMRSARTAGFVNAGSLMVTVDDLYAPNPIDGECLQVLREFGADAPVILVSKDSSLRTTLDQLLPDSFGPEAL